MSQKGGASDLVPSINIVLRDLPRVASKLGGGGEVWRGMGKASL